MIENKELPSEYVSIRQVWLQNITRCSEAISNRAKPDASHEAEWQEVGARTVIYSVRALYYSLIDYGEAIVKTEVTQYKINVLNKKLEGKHPVGYIADVYETLFTKIIEVLNKYGMLFEKQPKGYSNVEMKNNI
jgi:hypothetical protein